MDETAKSDGDGTNVSAAPDLAAVAAQIADEFPLVLEQTSLVLLDVNPEHLHAFWTLAPDDVARADAAFPADCGAAESVIRLRRLHAGGAAEVLATLPMAGGTQGDARFAVANDDGTYQAELGLRNGSGGWVLLARSNQARLPRPVGIPIPHWTGEDRRSAIPPASLAPASVPSLPSAPSAVPKPTGADVTDVAGGAQPRQAPLLASAPEPLPTPGTRPARWVLAVATAGGSAAASPTTGPATLAAPEGASLEMGADPHPNLAPAAEPPLVRPWQPAIPVDWHWANEAGRSPENAGAVAWGAPGLPGSAGARPSPAPIEPDTAAQREPPGPISSFALGRGPEAPVVEAEVLVHVSASPGTLVDLYGRPLRVGPSGRSTLRFPVSDLDTLERLLGSPADPEGPTGRG